MINDDNVSYPGLIVRSLDDVVPNWCFPGRDVIKLQPSTESIYVIQMTTDAKYVFRVKICRNEILREIFTNKDVLSLR